MRTGVLASAACGLALVACSSVREPELDLPTFVVPPRATFVRRVPADGVLQAVQATPIAAPADATEPMKIAWIAEDGIPVQEGDVVLRFDDTELTRRLSDGRDDVASDDHELRKAALSSSATRSRRSRFAELAQREATVAHEFGKLDDTILSRNEIAEQTIDLTLADAKLVHSDRVQSIERGVARQQAEVHRVARGHHVKTVDHTQDALQRLSLTAPHDGLVVLTRRWNGSTARIGDTLWPGQQVAEVPIVDDLRAQVHVLESDAGDLEVGLGAEVFIDAQPGSSWSARVERVDALAQPRHPAVPVHYVGARLDLEHTDTERMHVGQRVRATIRIERPDVLVVPRQAVFERGGVRVVYRRAGQEFERVEVTLGSASAGQVVVLKGLDPGDTIALRDPALEAGGGAAR